MSTTVVDDARDRAFERLYERYVREVYRYVLAVLRNPSEAEDVTQTTFLNAYRAIQAGADPQRPHNWLIAIAHNACRSRARFAVRRPKEVPLDELVEQLAVPESERLNVRELLRALGRLPFNQRAALTMREFEGRTYPEIAERLGVTVPAVEALITRARKSLRQQQAAFRGFALIQLPTAAKVAAVLAVGVVASSVGSAPTVKAETPERVVVKPRVEQQQDPAPVSAPTFHRHSTPSVRLGTPAAKHETPARAIVRPRPSPESIDPTTSPAVPAAPAEAPAAPVTVANTPVSLPQTPAPPLPIELPPLPEPPPVPPPDLPPPPALPLP